MTLTRTTAQAPASRAKYPGYWTIKKWRRRSRNRINAWLSFNRKAKPLQPIDPAAIRRVLLCRRNSRLGNTLFLVPLIRALNQALPAAEIDVLIGNEKLIPLLNDLPGVRQVTAMPVRGWTYLLHILRMFRQLRAQQYDLCVEPTLNSFSGRLLAKFAGARMQLGFHSPSQWLEITHAVIVDKAIRHEALKPLQLIRDCIDCSVPTIADSRLTFTAEEIKTGKELLHEALGTRSSGPTIGFFMHATGKKLLPREWWQAWLASLQHAGQPLRLVQIIPPGVQSAIGADLPTINEPNHRRLATVMRGLDLFVSCDAGPMHLAAAAGTKTIGLFHATSQQRYAPLGDECMGLDVSGRTPAQVAQIVLHQLDTPNPISPSRPAHYKIAHFSRHAAAEARQVDHQQYVPAD